ncbi:MAG: ABC transporter permease [Flavobacteriaceae bacterium]|nr:MAG: ABC transporter permease [Flavobacteriaceae bacterium]
MIRNHFKIAWRNLFKNKRNTIINVGGLSVGITVVVLIALWIHDELTYNQNHDNYERIARVFVHKTNNGNTRTLPVIPYPLGNELRNTYQSNFEHVVMSSYHDNHILAVGEKALSINGGYMEPDALKMLSLDMLSGHWDVLKDPNAIVISEATAAAFFGEEEPIGQAMVISNKATVTVRGIFKDLPANAEFGDLKFIAPWELYVSSHVWVKNARDKNLWDNNSYRLYVQIAKGTSMEGVSNKIKKTLYNNVPDYSKKTNPEVFLFPMKDWHLRANWENGKNVGGFLQYVWLFGIIGFFVLLLACINFMNLCTAQSEKRAKEVGIRKAIGSSRKQLIYQFLSEASLVVFLAFALALLFVIAVLPGFNELANKQLLLPFSSMYFWEISVVFIVLTSLFAGSYPALYLSAFRPSKVLKGVFKTAKSTTNFRKVLVVSQFTVSVVLAIGAMIIYKQIQHSKEREVGYEKDALVMISKTTEDYEGKYNFLRSELINSGAVLDMSESSSPITGLWSNGGGFNWEGKDPDFMTSLFMVCISHDYGKTIGWNLAEGRDFSRNFATDSLAFVLNEAAVAYLSLKDPIGKTIKWNDQDHQVIGIAENMLARSPFQPADPTVYMIKYDNTNWIELKLNAKNGIAASLATVESVFTKNFPKVPFEYQFVDDAFAEKFIAVERIGKLSGVFAFLAILISCLGLFGLASFIAEQRTKELGVRKVLGASLYDLWQLLSKDFISIILVSCAIAAPIAYYIMTEWLAKYTYRIEISGTIFIWAIGGALLITIITVSFQTLKAARANPIKSLRTE